MPHRLEITLKPEIMDAEGLAVCHKARDYFGIELDAVRTVRIITLDADLRPEQLETVRQVIFTNPVTQMSSYQPLAIPFDYLIWVGLRPGVRDNPGATALEAIRDVLGGNLAPEAGIYTSRRYCLQGAALTEAQTRLVATELLANDIIQQYRIYSPTDWDPGTGIGWIVPKVQLAHQPEVGTFSVDSDATLERLSNARNLALHPQDIPVIRQYFADPRVQAERACYGLGDPTDVELEYLSQARSDHCNHNTFRGLFRYQETPPAPVEIIDNLFKTCIEGPTRDLKETRPWVVSVLWDNAGVARFDDDHYYVITGETHNSPSNMEAYGGALTGIVGVYRDPLGTGKGARLIMGAYGFCVGPRDYDGELTPRLHPRRLLDGIVEGVKDGGNKSGIPTMFGQTLFHNGYLGKCLVYVTALGLMPARIDGLPAEQKTTADGDLVIMCGGRVGKDGIHGVTASSESYSEHTPAGHVQIGDPYTQKKMHDFLLEARDAGLIAFLTDNGGGGLSSSVGESALFSNGCEIELDKVPLKYSGLNPWEIWISESQERMTVAVKPHHREPFMALAALHEVECTVIGRYTASGFLHITYKGQTCARVHLDLLEAGFPQWEFDACWQTPEARGLMEPVLGEPRDYNAALLALLARPNICSKEWITRQYDHEVQGSSVIKPLVGVGRNVPADAVVLRPVLNSSRGLAFAQALLPFYSRIDAWHSVTCTVDEALRRVVAVGGDPEQVGGIDNFCWPNIQYHPQQNPDGRFKAAQLVRACQALQHICLAYGVPLLSGKDSMYVDGHLAGSFGETHKVSALETLQFATSTIVHDTDTCMTPDPKLPGHLVYVLGETRNELGASEYYDRLGYVGLQVPQVHDPVASLTLYRRLADAIRKGLTASVHGIYRGGLAVHAALVAVAGGLGLTLNLSQLPVPDQHKSNQMRTDHLLFSESTGRFLVTVPPDQQAAFEALMAGLPAARVGEVVADPVLIIRSSETSAPVIRIAISDLQQAWQRPFAHL